MMAAKKKEHNPLDHAMDELEKEAEGTSPEKLEYSHVCSCGHDHGEHHKKKTHKKY